MSEHTFQVPFCSGCGTAGCAAALNAEIAALKARIANLENGIAVTMGEWDHALGRAERTEGEIASLKAVLAEAVCQTIGVLEDRDEARALLVEAERERDEARAEAERYRVLFAALPAQIRARSEPDDEIDRIYAALKAGPTGEMQARAKAAESDLTEARQTLAEAREALNWALGEVRLPHIDPRFDSKEVVEATRESFFANRAAARALLARLSEPHETR